MNIKGKILTAAIICMAASVPVSIAVASNDEAYEGPVTTVDDGAPDALPPAGKYIFTVNPKSTVHIQLCSRALQWGKLKNGKLSTFTGTIDENGDVAISGSSIKGQLPKLSLDGAGCIGIVGNGSSFQGIATGTHDKKYSPPADWKGHLKKDAADTTESYLNTPINNNSHIHNSKFGRGDCFIGEVVNPADGTFTDYINLIFNKVTYTTKGSEVSIKLSNDLPFDFPKPFKPFPASAILICNDMEKKLNGKLVPVIYDVTVKGKRIG